METERVQYKIGLAEKIVAVETPYTRSYRMCRDYLTDGEPDIRVSISETDIQHERDEAEEIQTAGYLETLAVYRKIAEAMVDFDTFLMHGAAVAVDGEAYLFIAKSGTGKTTHIRKWLENLDNAVVVNGDKPLVRADSAGVTVFGTPWCGKENMNTNTSAHLKAIIVMERAEENAMCRLTFSEAFPTLLQQTYRPTDVAKMKKTLSLLSSLNHRVELFRFDFNNFKDDAFSTAFDALTK